MICLTAGEQQLEDLARRLRSRRSEPETLHEVRLDLLQRIDEQVYPLLRGADLVVTCRGSTEGGGFTGSEEERRQILLRTLDERPGFLDVELSAPSSLRREIWARRGPTRLILSQHRFEPGGAIPSGVRDLAEEPADLLKIAVTVRDAAELGLLRLALASEQRPVLRIGMGQAGLLSRALPSRFGSPWTYLVPDGASPVAPGQLALSRARAWRVLEEQHLRPLALVGGPQVHRSPGPGVYNRLFVERRLPFLYLPVETSRPAPTLDLLEALGFAGCSVTMPAKEVLAAQMDELLSPADRLQAVNTVRLEAGRRIGLNTDVEAVRRLLARWAGEPALVLGAGGAARAAISALRSLGCPVVVAGRREESLAALSNDLGAGTVPWARRTAVPFSILVNTTPLGSDGQTDPFPAFEQWRGRVVLDMVLGDGPTPLLRRAQAGGGQTCDGLSMWTIQGSLQLQALTGQTLSVEEISSALGRSPAQGPTAGPDPHGGGA